MVPQRSSHSRGRILAVLAVAAIAIILVTFWTSWPPVDTLFVVSQENRVDNMSDSVLSALKVSVRQASTSPQKLAIGVTNNHSGPVTVFTWDSPLDPLALQLGLLTFTPEGADKPIDIPRIQVRRIVPPPDDSFVTIEPGQTKEQDVLLKRPLIPLDQFQGRIEVICKGQWRAVWASKKEDIPAESLENAQVDAAAFRGSFESESVVVDF
ncbi:hypothetical protein GGS21DRAFT_494403 [Xylaria nigripes]|nr:hypothetical protein GGS21DRAFT_494403 [Xylaria nigripes]